jgi:hypothetical protein
MPNCGIHAYCSTNWYSALDGSNRHQRTSVSANGPVAAAARQQHEQRAGQGNEDD